MKKYHIFLLFIFLLGSCGQTYCPEPLSKENTLVKYAGLFSIENYENYKILHIYKSKTGKDTYTYVLARSHEIIPDSLKKFTFIQIPVKNLIVTSTTHLPALSMLNEENALKGFPDTRYISSPSFRKKIEENKIEETGFQGQLNTEKILRLNPELLILSARVNTQGDKIYTKNGIPVLYNADWMENDPLGRAEWIKVFGLIFDKTTQADSLFRLIEQNYKTLKLSVQSKQKKPLVFQGGKFGDKWYVPGGNSYAAQLINDAGGKYMWEKDQHGGSIPLNYENVLIKLPKADIWLNPGMYVTKNELSKDFPAANNLPVYVNDKIYTYNLKKGSTGGVLYFEYSNAHPDWVLNDLYHIFYPREDGYRFKFYEKLP